MSEPTQEIENEIESAAASEQEHTVKDSSIPEPKTSENEQVEKRTARVAEHVQVVELSGDESEDEEDIGDREDGDLLAGFPDDTEDLDLVHARLSALGALRLERFASHLKRLCLRQNFIWHLDPNVFGKLTLLEDLDFYDNKLKSIGDALDNCLGLKSLDLSFNLLRHVPDHLEKLQSLSTVYFVQNRINHVTNLNGLGATLRSLELGGNRIRKIEQLDGLVNLEELWLGKNKITKLENLDSLKKLRILSLQSNRITAIEGLDELVNLEQIYLSHNGVQRIQGLENNRKLETLDLGANAVTALENVSHLTELEELWLNNNQIPDLTALEKELSHIKSLGTLYLEGNPCEKAEGAAYRRKIMVALPQLSQIDATYTKKEA